MAFAHNLRVRTRIDGIFGVGGFCWFFFVCGFDGFDGISGISGISGIGGIGGIGGFDGISGIGGITWVVAQVYIAIFWFNDDCFFLGCYCIDNNDYAARIFYD